MCTVSSCVKGRFCPSRSVGPFGASISEQFALARSCVFESLTGSFSELDPFAAGGAVDPTPVGEAFRNGARCSTTGEALCPKLPAAILDVSGLTDFDLELGTSCELSLLRDRKSVV